MERIKSNFGNFSEEFDQILLKLDNYTKEHMELYSKCNQSEELSKLKSKF